MVSKVDILPGFEASFELNSNLFVMDVFGCRERCAKYFFCCRAVKLLTSSVPQIVCRSLLLNTKLHSVPGFRLYPPLTIFRNIDV